MSGSQFLRLKRIELEEFVRFTKVRIENLRWSLAHYSYTAEDLEQVHREMAMLQGDVRIAEQELGIGAENEEILTESKSDSESPQKFTEINCTTVL